VASSSYTNFRTVAPGQPNKPDTGTNRDIRCRQIDELIAQSEEARRDVYGPNQDTDDKNFYNLFERERKMPTFRPRIAAPQLQILLLNEVADLTDANVRVFIHKGDERDKEREDAFQMHWKQEFFQLQLVMAQVYAQFSGLAFLEVGNDPFAKQGKGNVWLRARRMGDVYCDPISWWPPDWNWQVIKNRHPLDRIRKWFGKPAEGIRPKGAKTTDLAGPPAGQIEMPPGPMSVTMRGLPTEGSNYEDASQLDVRSCYIHDYTMRELDTGEAKVFEERKIPIPEQVPMYPHGRMVVDCEGVVLSDGDSWCPLGELWPSIPVWATPPWDTVWCPNPKKYTKSLQDAAEQQMTNTFENARRLNQGFLVIHATTGLTANTVGGLPGEVLVVAANSPPGQGIEVKYPPPFPPQMTQLPMSYLALQKEMRGATAARTGNTQPGNIGADLFDAAVNASQSSTRLTAKFFSWSVQKACELLFYTMGKTWTEDMTFRDKTEAAKWTKETDLGDYGIQLPEGAIRPMSQTALRNMVIELRKAGMIDIKHALSWLDVPDADDIAEAIEAEQKLAALAKQKRS
jgi:hypothetical protein